MFEAKLKSRSQPKLGALAVTFPIPEERYENVILALQNLQIGDVRKQDCCIESIRAPDCPALVRMTGTMANVDELDWLGKQLESFDRYELLQFNAAVERFGLSAADELIDLSFCAREVTVISDFTDLEKTGKRHYLTVHGACDPKELENLDGKETALALISGQPGYVTRYGVVYDNGIKLEQAYDRKHLPPICMAENCILELKIRATEDAFWNGHVQKHQPPDYTESGDLILQSLQRWKGIDRRDLPPAAFGAPQLPQIHQYLQLQEQKGVLAKQVTQLEAQMQQLKGLLVSELGGKDCATCADGEQNYVTEPVRDIIRSACWRTRFTETAKTSATANCTESGSAVRHWEDREGTSSAIGGRPISTRMNG